MKYLINKTQIFVAGLQFVESQQFIATIDKNVNQNIKWKLGSRSVDEHTFTCKTFSYCEYIKKKAK